MEAINRKLAVLVCAATICAGTVASAVASAQANPEMGDTGEGQGQWAPPAAGAEASASASASTETGVEASADSSSESEPSTPGTGAHAEMVGALGVGFFGVTNVPVCAGPTACGPGDAINAPTIGVRYWLSEGLGIEAALGIGIESGTISSTGAPDSFENSFTAVALHGGIPIALAYSGNFVFEVVPELDLGFATGTQYGNTAAEDLDLSGFLFQLGGRVGAEIHFGFIGLPQLSLQGTVGMHLRMTSQSFEDSMGGEASVSRTRFATSVQEEPWDLFTGSVRAIYYFQM